jgi:hypothetical protein
VDQNISHIGIGMADGWTLPFSSLCETFLETFNIFSFWWKFIKFGDPRELLPHNKQKTFSKDQIYPFKVNTYILVVKGRNLP